MNTDTRHIEAQIAQVPAPEPALVPFIPFSAIVAGRRLEDAHARGEVGFDIPADWLQGRTAFGGLTSAIALQAMRDVAGRDWPAGVALRALQTNFIAPVAQGAVTVAVQVLREGRNVRQVLARVLQGGEVSAVLVGVFASARETTLPPLEPARPPPAHEIDALPPMPPSRVPPALRPAFIRHFDMRWASGAPPFSGAGSWEAQIHLRLTDFDAASLPTELLTVLLADAPPSPATSHFSRPSAASSVSWALEMRPLPPDEPLAGWWRSDNRTLAAGDGYTNQQFLLWSPEGRLAALSYQVVTLYG
jgi:acyl-CoA thioesterase